MAAGVPDATRKNRINGRTVIIILCIVLVVLFLLSFILGRYASSPIDVVKVLVSQVFPLDHTWPDSLDTVVMQNRLPRILAAILVGAGLAAAGACFQGLFQNPLVSPDILGVSSGAGFGAALAILLSGGSMVIQASSFTGGLLTVGIAYGVSRMVKGNVILNLILVGIAIDTFFVALIVLLTYLADPMRQLPQITYWLMGSLASVNLPRLLIASGPILVGIVLMLLIRWRFNVLAMGEEEAMALGVDTGRIRAAIIVCCTMITASSVCISGIIGWVGLIIPHVGRMLVGPDHKILLPVSLLLGANYLLLMDDICRISSRMEIPIGILTAIIGVPFFIYMLSRSRKGWA